MFKTLHGGLVASVNCRFINPLPHEHRNSHKKFFFHMNQLLCDLVAWPEPFFDFKIRHFEEKKVMPIGNSMQNRTNSVLQSGVPIGNTMRLLRNLSCHSFVPNGNTMLFTNNYHCSSICAVWQHYAYLRKSRIFVVQCQTATACSFGNSLSVP
mgnify:CR=1 FL=1